LVENMSNYLIYPYIEVKGDCRIFFNMSSQLFNVGIFLIQIFFISQIKNFKNSVSKEALRLCTVINIVSIETGILDMKLAHIY
jgi:hypothetical protein